MRICPRCATQLRPGAAACPACHLSLDAPPDPRLQDEPPSPPEGDSPEDDIPVEDARKALRAIERKRVGLSLWGDRKRTRRVHFGCLTGFLVVLGGMVLNVLFNDRTPLGDRLVLLFAVGVPAACFFGGCPGVVVGVFSDLWTSFADLCSRIMGRKRPDLDRIARRIHDRPAAAGPTPADPETAVRPAGREGPPAADESATDAVTRDAPPSSPP